MIGTLLRRVAIVLAVLLVVVAVIAYVWAIESKEVLDAVARKEAPGGFTRLPAGTVHFEMSGPPDGPTVVLIHGLTTPSFVWDHNVQALTDAGFQVLRYDHFGRGYSDRPDIVYDRDLYDQQVHLLLDKFQVEPPVHLVGLSMGGAVAVTFTDRHPDMVASVSLLAPAGFPIEEPWYLTMAKVRLVGDYFMTVFGDRLIRNGVRNAFVDPDGLGDFEAKFEVQLRYRGLRQAVLSTLRSMGMFDLGDTYHRVGKLEKPALLLWGRRDAVLPFDNSAKVLEAIPHAEFHAIDVAGHNLNYEDSEIVNPLLVDFLERAVTERGER
jgi:pimeloyl-ACP methyl ester carboxylesterase